MSLFGSSEASEMLERELRDNVDPKLPSKVGRVITAQLTHLSNFNRIENSKSRAYARQLWRHALPDTVAENTWPEKIRTLTLNVLSYHYKMSTEMLDEEI
jgi:hypothetical protein